MSAKADALRETNRESSFSSADTRPPGNSFPVSRSPRASAAWKRVAPSSPGATNAAASRQLRENSKMAELFNSADDRPSKPLLSFAHVLHAQARRGNASRGTRQERQMALQAASYAKTCRWRSCLTPPMHAVRATPFPCSRSPRASAAGKRAAANSPGAANGSASPQLRENLEMTELFNSAEARPSKPLLSFAHVLHAQARRGNAWPRGRQKRRMALQAANYARTWKWRVV